MKRRAVNLVVLLQVLLLESATGFSLFDRKCHIKKVPSQWFPRPIAIQVGHQCYPYRKDDGSSDEPIMPDMESRCCPCLPPGTKTTPTIARVSTTRPLTGVTEGELGVTGLSELQTGTAESGSVTSGEGGPGPGSVEGGGPGSIEGGSTEGAGGSVEGGSGGSEGGAGEGPTKSPGGVTEETTESPGEGGLTEGGAGGAEGGGSGTDQASKIPEGMSTERPEGPVSDGPGEVPPTGEPRAPAVPTDYPGEVTDETELPGVTAYPGEVTSERVPEGGIDTGMGTPPNDKAGNLETKIEQLIEDISHLQCKNESSLEGIIAEAKNLNDEDDD